MFASRTHESGRNGRDKPRLSESPGFLLLKHSIKAGFAGIAKGQVPLRVIIAPVLVYLFARFLHLDDLAWAYFGFYNPIQTQLQHGVVVCSIPVVALSFWCLRQGRERLVFEQKLARAFGMVGLVNRLGNAPKLLSDVQLDADSRRMTLGSAALTQKQFEAARENLEAGLQIHIDEIKEARGKGLISIQYAHKPMPHSVPYLEQPELGSLRFGVGLSRSRWFVGNLRKTPHWLIAGQTGGGKSTFLRQMLTSLYFGSDTLEMTLIDLKGGLEFQLFERLPRVKVLPSLGEVMSEIDAVQSVLETRMKLLRNLKVKDIDSFHRLPQKKKAGSPKINRQLIVVDEATELFLTGGGLNPEQVNRAKRVLGQVARQGRAVGLHLVIATQRPDARALDPQIKANLPGIVCFQMVNLASSMTVLGNGRAVNLPAIAGRAVYREGMEEIELQTPFLEADRVEQWLKELRTEAPHLKASNRGNRKPQLVSAMNQGMESEDAKH